MFAVPKQKGLTSPDYVVFESVISVKVKYFEYLFKTPIFVQQFAQKSKGIGSGFNRLYTTDFGGIFTISPPLTEQAAIAAHLDKATAAIDAAVACARRQVELLREYRARLIADVVTGKLDVRKAAANLPDESGESAILLPEKRSK